jgi:hypothetical protein
VKLRILINSNAQHGIVLLRWQPGRAIWCQRGAKAAAGDALHHRQTTFQFRRQAAKAPQQRTSVRRNARSICSATAGSLGALNSVGNKL